MSQTLNILNFPDKNIVGQTQLTSSVPSGSMSLQVVNATDFNTKYVLIGTSGSNISEIQPNADATSGTTINLSLATVLQYNQFDPVYALFGNQLKIYRATNVDGTQPADTAFTLLATINIDPTTDKTTYTDATGGGNYWYKVTYYNSNSHNETDIGSSRAVRGNFTTNYVSLDEIRREAGFRFAPYITDNQIDEMRQAAQDEINGALDDFYVTPFQPPINDFVRRITKRLAAGYLRLAQYSQISDSKINGQDMVDGAQADLELLITKQRVVVNKQGQALDRAGGAGEAEGWPNSSTDTADPNSGGAPRVFRMSDIQGQPQGTDSSGNPVGNVYYGRRW